VSFLRTNDVALAFPSAFAINDAFRGSLSSLILLKWVWIALIGLLVEMLTGDVS